MEFEMNAHIVYVKPNDSGHITAVNSSAFLPDITGWMEIDGGYGDKYHHAQGNYFPQPIIDERGIYRYKLVDGKPVERTKEEMDADYAANTLPGATQLDRIEAQIMYTAIMTDTMIEEV